jgi:hypothetical protein
MNAALPSQHSEHYSNHKACVIDILSQLPIPQPQNLICSLYLQTRFCHLQSPHSSCWGGQRIPNCQVMMLVVVHAFLDKAVSCRAILQITSYCPQRHSNWQDHMYETKLGLNLTKTKSNMVWWTVVWPIHITSLASWSMFESAKTRKKP